MKRAIRENRERLKEIADVDAQNMINAIKAGDMSFGMKDLARVNSSVTRAAPVQPTMSHRPVALPPAQPQQGPPMPPLQPRQPVANGAGQPHPWLLARPHACSLACPEQV